MTTTSWRVAKEEADDEGAVERTVYGARCVERTLEKC